MKFRKSYLLILIIICLVSLSAVSAEANNETSDNLTDIDEEVLDPEPPEPEDVQASEGTFRNLYTSINSASGTLTLSKDYKFSTSNYYDTRYYIEGVPVSKSITINGNGHYIDANYNSRIFSVTSSNLVLKNIVFKNAVWDHGGAIYWKGGGGSIINCTFVNCTSYDGSAIFALNSTLTVQNSTFRDNYAYFSGGAIYEMYGNLAVYNSFFYNNTAYDGGAICIDAYYSFKLINSNFTMNYADRYGGAVATLFNSALTNTNCKFTNNQAFKGNNIYNIELSEILDTSSYVDSLLEFFPDDVTVFPEYYDLRKEGYLTPVKDQGSDGNCWSFAAMAALESALLKATGVTYDFSENNLKNLAAWFSDYGKNIETNEGGNYWMSVGYLSSWLGPVNESADPYYDDGNLFSDLFLPLFHVQDVAFVKRTSISNLNVIKKALMMYGAVATNLYTSTEYRTGANFYCPEELTINHAIAIIGWNDTYSRNNFKTTPEGDGAWIIKNSWGEDSGDGGYFYVSYYDKTLALDSHGYSYVFVFNNTVNYENIYQHEFVRSGNFWWDATSDNINSSEMVSNNVWFKNVYTARDDEFLAAVSTWFDYNINYDITINVTHKGASTVYTQSGSAQAGYHTIKLNKYIPLEKGDVFSVTFRFKNLYWFAIYRGSLSFRNFSQPGISFSSWNGKTWVDLYDYNDIACIKAFTINHVNSTMTVLDIGSPKVSDSFNIAVKVTDPFGNLVNKGNVTFIINNTKYVLNTTNGIANLTLKLSKAGIYKLNCTFEAPNYYSSSKALQFEVFKHTSSVNVNVADIDYKKSLTVNVTLSSNATGKVFIKINNTVYANVSITNSKASYTFSNLNAGNYNVNVTYYGDDYYYASNKTASFKVNKIAPALSINTISNVIYPGNITVSYTLTSGATGNFNISVFKGNILKTSKITNKKTESFKLDAGSYSIKVTYLGDNNYLSVNKSSTFTVIKASSQILATNIKSISYGEGLNVTVKLTNSTNASYTLIYNSKTLKTGYVQNNLIFNDLNAGNYTLSLIANGDDNHNSSNATYNFEVFKTNANLTISPISTIVFGDELNVIYSTPLKGNVKVSIYKNNVLIDTSTVNTSKASFKNLSAGNYNVSVEYLENLNYYDTVKNTSFTVNKAKSAIILTAPSNITYGEVFMANISLVNASNAMYKLYFNSNLVKNASVSSKLNFTDLQAGNYTLEIEVAESENFKSSNCTFNFKVLKADVNLYSNILNVVYGNNISIPLNINATGNTNILIYKNKVLFINKTAGVSETINLSLNAGDYNVTISYLGDSNHNQATFKSNFKVFKASSSISIEKLENIIYGDDLNIIINLINGSETHYDLYKNTNLIKNGTIETIRDLNAGNYTIILYNLGDDNHNQSSIKTNFTVFKFTPSLNINQISNVVYNNTVKVNYSIDLDVNVNVVLIKDSALISNQTTNKNLTFTNLDSGNYTVIVEYFGDDNHVSIFKNQTFKVFKASSSVEALNVKNITYGDNLTVGALLINATSGRFDLIFQDDVIKTGSLNNIYLSNLNAGDYTLNLYSYGDSNHNPSNASYTFTVKKATLTLSVEDISDIVYNSTLNVDFNLDNVVVTLVRDGFVLNRTGSRHVSFDGLDAGNYSINVTYPGDENHFAVDYNSTFKVFKAASSIDVLNIKNITFGDDLSLDVILTNGSEGKYELFFDEALINENNLDNMYFTGLNAGNYTIKVYNYGDSNHNSSNASYDFTVKKATLTLSVDDISDIVYNNTLNVDFNLDNVVVTLVRDGLVLNKTGSRHVSFDGLDAGNYSINVKYPGDENHFAVDYNSTFKVFKAASSIDVLNIKNITFGDDLSLEVILTNGSEGKYELFFDEALVDENNLDNMHFSNLNAGNYTIKVYNYGDSNHNSSNASYDFTVKKATLTLSVEDISDIVYNSTLNVDFNLDNVVVTLVRDTFVLNKTGSRHVSFDGLDAGNYSINVKYPGDANHFAVDYNSTFNVFKAASSVNALNLKNITYGDNLTVDVNLINATSGRYDLIYLGETLKTGTLDSIQLELDAGNYTLNLYNYGDLNHNPSNASYNFTVFKASSSAEITDIKNITYGEELTLNSKLTNSSAGKYQLYFNNVMIGENTIENIHFTNLNAGNYTIAVLNYGDKNHNPSNASYNFTVKKAIPNLVISPVLDIVYGNSLNVSYNLENSRVSIYKGDVLAANKTSDFNAVFNNLSAGFYKVNVKYLGDSNHISVDANSSFTVLKASSSAEITNIKNITYGDELSLNSKLTNSSAGKYQLYFNNVMIDENTCENIHFTNLNAGNYTITVFNYGNENHNPSNATYSFEVFKATPKLVISDINNIVYGNSLDIEFDINIPVNVTVNVFKSSELVAFKTSTSNVQFTNLDSGVYNVSAIYLGDKNYNGVSASSSFEVFKASSSVEITNLSNITYGEVLSLKTILINGSDVKSELYFKNNLISKNTLEFDNLASGNYTITVLNDGDENHNPSNATYSFEVFKATLELIINEITNITFAESADIHFNTNNTRVSIYKDSVLISNKTDDFNVRFDNLDAGIYNVNVKYLGDANHNSVDKNTSFEVFKATSSVEITGIKNITYGDSLSLNVNIINGSNPKSYLYLENRLIAEDIFEFNNLASGNYTITVLNYGDKNHNPSNASYNFTVNKAMPHLTLEDISDIYYSELLNINFSIDINAKVQVSIFSGSELISFKTTSENSVSFKNLNADSYTAVVEYLGDNNYLNVSKSKNFTVHKASSSVEITNIRNITYGNALNLNAKLINSSASNYKLYFKNQIIAEDNITSLSFSNLNAGNYEIILYNYGDANHNASNASYSFEVFKADSTFMIYNIANVVYGRSVHISFNINNTSLSIYKGDNLILNENADYDFYADNLDVGNYKVNVEYLGDANHNKAVASKTFSVFMASSSVEITNIRNITYGDDLKITSLLVNGSTGRYQLMRGNEIVSVDATTNPVFKSLEAGNYILTVYNDGDANHKPSSANSTFTVLKSIPQLVVTPLDDISYNSTQNVYFNIENATGEFKISLFRQNKLISSTKTSNKTVNFTNVALGNYNVVVEYLGDNNYLTTSKNLTFTVFKASSAIELNALDNLHYGDKVKINLNYINGTGYWELFLNKNKIEDISNLSVGTYTIKLYNVGDENHNPSTLTKKFTIEKANPIIRVEKISNAVFGENINVNFKTSIPANFEVTVQKNNIQVYKTYSDATSFTLPVMDVGVYNLIIASVEDENHNRVLYLTKFTIEKASSSVFINPISNITYGETQNISLKLENSTTGYYKLLNNDIEVLSDVLCETIVFKDLPAGEYKIVAFNGVDENHYSSSDESAFVVFKKTPSISITPIDEAYFNQSVNISYTSSDALKGKVNILVFARGDLILNETLDVFENLSLNNFKSGKYSVDLTYLEDDNFTQKTFTYNFTVKSIISRVDINISSDKDFEIISNDNNYVINYDNNSISISVENLDDLIITVNNKTYINKTSLKLFSYELDAYININVTLDDKKPADLFSDVVKAKKTSDISYVGGKISINLSDDAGGNISLNINNKTYHSKIINGLLAVSISDLADGEYEYLIEYSGDEKYEAFTYEGNLSVLNTQKTKITLSSQKAPYNGAVTVKLTPALGGFEISVKGLGSVKTLKTDKNGQTVLLLSNLKPQTYSVKFTFKGDGKYLSTTLTSKLTVLKIKPTLIAGKKTFKQKLKVKKYKITLKGIKKAKVTLKVKGKKYTAKTNNKGRAIFKLKNLKNKGSYKAIIQYKGDNYYNSIKKSVKIKVI